jgi:hypothetical protein
MQNRLYQWLFFVCLLILPVGTNAKIDTQKAQPVLFENTPISKNQGIAEAAKKIESVRMPRFLKKIILKRLYTEGSLKKTEKQKSTIGGKIFTAILLIIAAVLLVYWLQGTIGLLLATLGIGAYLRNRGNIADWERRRYERLNAPEVVAKKNERDAKGNASTSLSHSSNRFTRRALTRFLIGVGLAFLALIMLILSLFSEISAIAGILIVLTFITGTIFTLVSVVNAFTAITNQEPQSGWAWLVVVFGILGALSFLSLILALGSL